VAIELIESHDAFCRLENDWQSTYRADHEASVFLSWRWMHSLLIGRADQPCIIAWYDDSIADSANDKPHFRAFLPMRRQVRLSHSRGEFYNAMSFAGNYWADYTGVLCDPAVQAQAVPELGAALSSLSWRRLYLEGIGQSSERVEALLAAVREDENLRLETRHLSDNDGATDLGKAPTVTLPNSFEAWLQGSLSANTRQKLRRFRRRLSADDAFNLRLTTVQTLESDIAALQRFWHLRWAEAKGRHVDTLADKYAALVREGLNAGDMILLVLSYNGEPVALHACYVDPVRRVLSFFVGARDLSFSLVAPGLILHAHAIEWAIEQQLAQYDLLRGDETYKYSLGAVDQAVESFLITRQHLPVEYRFLDIECRAAALSALQAYQSHARASKVHDLYSQLLESWPGDASVLTQYASWLQTTGDQYTADAISGSLQAEPVAAKGACAITCAIKSVADSASG